jgi:hypothetical protein
MQQRVERFVSGGRNGPSLDQAEVVEEFYILDPQQANGQGRNRTAEKEESVYSRGYREHRSIRADEFDPPFGPRYC